METITKTIYLNAVPSDFEDGGYRYSMLDFDRDDGINVGSIEVSIDIPEDFDLNSAHVEILKTEKNKIYAEAQLKCNNLEEQIQSLLAIEAPK